MPMNMKEENKLNSNNMKNKNSKLRTLTRLKIISKIISFNRISITNSSSHTTTIISSNNHHCSNSSNNHLGIINHPMCHLINILLNNSSISNISNNRCLNLHTVNIVNNSNYNSSSKIRWILETKWTRWVILKWTN